MHWLNEKIRRRWKTCTTVRKPDSVDNYVADCLPSTSRLAAHSQAPHPRLSASSHQNSHPTSASIHEHSPPADTPTQLPGPCHQNIDTPTTSTPKHKNSGDDFESWLDKGERQYEIYLQSQTEPFHFRDCDTTLDSTVSLPQERTTAEDQCVELDKSFDLSGDIFDQIKMFVDE